jgi:hypothetical protein
MTCSGASDVHLRDSSIASAASSISPNLSGLSRHAVARPSTQDPKGFAVHREPGCSIASVDGSDERNDALYTFLEGDTSKVNGAILVLKSLRCSSIRRSNSVIQ